jgi:hypothetical protein
MLLHGRTVKFVSDGIRDNVDTYFLKAIIALSDLRPGKDICSMVTPQLNMSKRSGFSMRQSTGDRKAATGAGGGRTVWVLITYC